MHPILQESPPVLTAGRFITEATTGGGTTLKDGRGICGICFKQRVVDPAEGKKILMKTYWELERLGIKFIHLNLILLL